MNMINTNDLVKESNIFTDKTMKTSFILDDKSKQTIKLNKYPDIEVSDANYYRIYYFQIEANIPDELVKQDILPSHYCKST